MKFAHAVVKRADSMIVSGEYSEMTARPADKRVCAFLIVSDCV